MFLLSCRRPLHHLPPSNVPMRFYVRHRGLPRTYNAPIASHSLHHVAPSLVPMASSSVNTRLYAHHGPPSTVPMASSSVNPRLYAHHGPPSTVPTASWSVNPRIYASTDAKPQEKRRKRSSAAKMSLRRVAVEAQRTRDIKDGKTSGDTERGTKTVTAICAANEYDLAAIVRTLESFGHQVDPCQTNLYPHLVHVALPTQRPDDSWHSGDLFIFPSGTVVAWDLPDAQLQSLVAKAFASAARMPLAKVEEEDLEYSEDSHRETSSIKGDTITLGLKNDIDAQDPGQNLDGLLTKIAFSSGLARSTKLAVLETMLSDYFESTKSIPEVLSRGGRMPFTRSFISQKTGQLLNIRAQLNLYSELTDSLPDLFWDSRHELGLEGYYDQMGRALDTNIRIKILNEKMDYAQEIASVLRQQLSEKHGVRLEWIIILLIFVEVVFAMHKEMPFS